MLAWLKAFVKWITGPDIFLNWTEASDVELLEECHRRIPWLTDEQLNHLMSACEVEVVNRMADDAVASGVSITNL